MASVAASSASRSLQATAEPWLDRVHLRGSRIAVGLVRLMCVLHVEPARIDALVARKPRRP